MIQIFATLLLQTGMNNSEMKAESDSIPEGSLDKQLLQYIRSQNSFNRLNFERISDYV